MSKLKQSFLTIAIGLILAAGISYAWTGPTANPPSENTSAPINVSLSRQAKSGGLTIGSSSILSTADGLYVNGATQVNGFRNVGSSIFDGLAELKSSIKIPTDAGVGKVLTSDASGKASWGITPFTRIAVFDLTSSWTVPAGVSNVIIEAWGGGGGGGRGCSGVYGRLGGTGGGGGGYGKGVYSAVEKEVFTIDVGKKGQGADGGKGRTRDGMDGDKTSVTRQTDGGVIISATGGIGGNGDGGYPGSGGTSTGIIKITGGVGDDAFVDNPEDVSNGARGGSAGNGGQGGGETEMYSEKGGAPGGGGGGGACRLYTRAGWYSGADGGDGRVVVWY